MNSRRSEASSSPTSQNAKFTSTDDNLASEDGQTEDGRSLAALVTRLPMQVAVQKLLSLPYLGQIKFVLDVLLILAAGAWAWWTSFSQVEIPGHIWPFLVAVLVARISVFCALGLQHSSWLHVSRFEVFRLVLSAVLGTPLIAALLYYLPDPFNLRPIVRPTWVLITEAAFYLLVMFGARITARALASSGTEIGVLKRVLIIGAGNSGKALAFQLQETQSGYQPVGFLDDDPGKRKSRYRGLPILGTLEQMPKAVQSRNVQEAIVAITHLEPERLKDLLRMGAECGVQMRILPSLREMLGGTPNMRQVREIRMEDLLPRPEVHLDRKSITAYLSDRTVLVTGGGGSIGGELCRQALEARPRRLVVLGRGENSVFEMVQELNELCEDEEFSCEIVPVICDVRDRTALEAVFATFHPKVVFHAAAHKHVPLMEKYPCEAVKNNVLGTLNVVELAAQEGVEHFVMVSTDKAVDPNNVMGASKRIGELLVQSCANATGMSMVCVRFGNVLGSRGSVVPTMTRQIRRGLPVTVTDPDMVRYFMTIPEAVGLILQAGALGGSGEVFILDMGHPVKIMDLAHDLIKMWGLVPEQDIPIRIVGKRPGEKMGEELLTGDEQRTAEKQGPFYKVLGEPLAWPALTQSVHQLVEQAERGDTAQVLYGIQDLIPSFKGSEAARALSAANQSQVNKASDNAKPIRNEGANGSHSASSARGTHVPAHSKSVPADTTTR